MARVCPKCGAQVKDSTMFCVSCGTRQARPQTARYTQQPPHYTQQPPQYTQPPPQYTQQPLILGDESSWRKPFFFLVALAIAIVVVLAAIGLEWWLVALLTAVGVFLNFAQMYINGRIIAGRTWLCPNCGAHFKLYKWYNYFFVPTINKYYKIRVQCPQCNARVWCGHIR